MIFLKTLMKLWNDWNNHKRKVTKNLNFWLLIAIDTLLKEMVMKEIGDIEEQLSDFEKIREQYPNDAENVCRG